MSSDLQLRQDVLEELEFEPEVDATHIGVAVHAGVVTLSGFVSSYAEKLAAERSVRQIKKVRVTAGGRKPVSRASPDGRSERTAMAPPIG